MAAQTDAFGGRYEILTKLGEGGFGAVYMARQRTTGQPVALKVMRPPQHGNAARAERQAARFLRETRVCAQLQHPNLVQLIDSGQASDGGLYMVFAYVPGSNLAEVLAAEGALAPREARHLMLQVLDALACAHARGVVHRDLKPSNIMVAPTGARRNALVLDFGIGGIIEGEAGEASQPLTESGDTLGTPGYGAPEQWRGGEPSPRADLFSWGLVFLECLTGRRVYGGGSAAEILYRLLGPEPVPMPPALERHPLGALLRRATCKDVAGRASSARELLEALDACDLRGLSREAIVGADTAPPGLVQPPPADVGFAPVEAPIEAGTELARELRQRTALCCHLHASAPGPGELTSGLFDELARAGVAVCADVARRHGGQVAAALGRELLVYFGSPGADERDAQRAARAALAVVAAVRAEDERLAAQGARLQVSVGIHTGLVGDDGPRGVGLAVGATAWLVTQLASLAPPGDVAVSAESRRLLRATFEVEAAGPRAVEGLAAPLAAYRLLGEREAHAFGSSPDDAPVPLVGRSQEVDLLLERWRRVRAGSGQSSLITGEPGIGKSRLAREVRDRLLGEAHDFLEGRCAPDTQNNALFPVVSLLGRALGLDRSPDASSKVARIEAQLEGYGLAPAEAMPLLLPLFALPVGAPYTLPNVSPQRQKELTLGAIVSLLLAMAEQRPLLLLVEDLHWADPTTIELLAQLVREAPSAALYLLLTARLEFSPSFSTIGMLQLHLGRLERPQIEALVAELVGHKALPAAVVDRVVDRTDGVPLFVEELTRMMIDSGTLVEREGGYELGRPLADVELPSSLRGLIMARLDRLGRAKETAQLAAVLGREFGVELLAAVSPLGAEAVQADLDRLMGAGLVFRRRRLKEPVASFKHALVRDAAYESLPRATRQGLHARVAATLEGHFPAVVRARPDLLAQHYAAAGQTRQAAGYAQLAAEQALQRSAYAEAAAHASDVVSWAGELPDTEAVAAELKANGVLTQAMIALGGWTDARVKALVDRSTALLRRAGPKSEHKVSTLWSLFTYHYVASNRAATHATVEELVATAERSGDDGFRAAALSVRGINLYVDGEGPKAERDLERAVELYDPARHRDHGARFGLDSFVVATTMLARLRWLSGDPRPVSQLLNPGLAWAREVGHVPSLAMGLLYGLILLQFTGDKAATLAMADELLALTGNYGLPAYEVYAVIVRDWATGDAERAEAILGRLTAMGCRLGLSHYGSLLADALADRGELDAAVARIDACLSLCRENDEHYYEPQLHLRQAGYALRMGTAGTGRALAHLEQAARLARRQHTPRIEVLARRGLLRYAADDRPHRARLDELIAGRPALQAIEPGYS